MKKGPLSIVLLCVVLALAIAGCGGSDDDSSSPSTSAGATDSESAGATDSERVDATSAKPKITVPDGPPPKQLETKDLIEGDGFEAKDGSVVSVNYLGVGYEGGKEFDTSWGKEPLTFALGTGAVIKGWDQGVAGMKVGGRRELIIPANLAYGSEGSSGIAPNETLIFIVDMLGVG